MAQLLALSDYWWGWANLLFRWLHVVAAMAWIGASFYFIALDNHLQSPKDPKDAKRGVGGVPGRLEVVVERDEVERRTDPRHRRDHVQPPEEQVAPPPPVVAER